MSQDRMQGVKQNIQVFMSAVQKLSSAVSKGSSLWQDEKYSELSSAIVAISNQSQKVLASGDNCCSALQQFYKIAEE